MVRPSEGIVLIKCVPKSFGQIFQHRTKEPKVAAANEHYIPAIFFISFSLFKASMGVRESMSRPLIWSRI